MVRRSSVKYSTSRATCATARSRSSARAMFIESRFRPMASSTKHKPHACAMPPNNERERIPMPRMTTQLRALMKRGFLELPATYDPITARLAESAGFKSIYNGGFVTGGKTCISEPLLTMNEQIATGGEIAKSVKVPVVMDAGAGWGEPLHTMRSVRECVLAGIAGVHIEDQLFPKRAHYHAYVVHNISRDEFIDKIRFACRARDETDRDFVIIARSDAARVDGIREAIDRVNAAADVGADMGLVFPRTHDEAVLTPKKSRLPMLYVQSRGTRDGRPLYTYKQLRDLGYAGCIDATLAIC